MVSHHCRSSDIIKVQICQVLSLAYLLTKIMIRQRIYRISFISHGVTHAKQNIYDV